MLVYESEHRAGMHYYDASIALQPKVQHSLVAVVDGMQMAVSSINKVELARLIALGYEQDVTNTFYVPLAYWEEAKVRNYQLKDEYIAKNKLEIQ